MTFAGEVAAEARKAVNTTCQGSAADIVKRAMLDVFEKLTVPDDRHGAPSRRTDASDDDAERMVRDFDASAAAARDATGAAFPWLPPLVVDVDSEEMDAGINDTPTLVVLMEEAEL